jgi:hypothetical protein
MTGYLVTRGLHCDKAPVAVFSKKSMAERFVAASHNNTGVDGFNPLEITEIPLDALVDVPKGMKVYKVEMNRAGVLRYCELASPCDLLKVDETWVEKKYPVRKLRDDKVIGVVTAENEEQAIAAVDAERQRALEHNLF